MSESNNWSRIDNYLSNRAVNLSRVISEQLCVWKMETLASLMDQTPNIPRGQQTCVKCQAGARFGVTDAIVISWGDYHLFRPALNCFGHVETAERIYKHMANVLLIYTSNGHGALAFIWWGISGQVQYSLFLLAVFALQHLLRDTSGSLAAKCSTVFGAEQVGTRLLDGDLTLALMLLCLFLKGHVMQDTSFWANGQ